MPTRYSFNFRRELGSFGEVLPNVAVLRIGNGPTTLYPTAYGAGNLGWSSETIVAEDSGGSDAQLSGLHFTNTTRDFSIDLPSGPGPYRIWVALGTPHAAGSVNSGMQIRNADETILHTVVSTSIPAGSVMDAQGNILTKAAWLSANGGSHVDVTFAGTRVKFRRDVATGNDFRVANIQIQSLAPPLEDAVLTTEYGTGVHAGTIFPKEPQGVKIGRITAPVGSQSFSLIAGSTYFTTETDNVGVWLVTTSTRIPDAWSGTVTIRQASDGDERDTDFVLTASTLDRPITGILGRVSSRTLFERARVKTVMQECWPGYTGQTLATDQVVTGRADFFTKFNALSETGWHRLRLQDGDYSGAGTLATKDWMASGGGVVIEPDTGHDPIFRATVRDCRQRGVHWRNCRLVPTRNGFEALFNCDIGAPYPVYRIEGCRVGAGFDTSFSISGWADWTNFLDFLFCEEVSAIGNEIVGVSNAFKVEGGRRMRFNENSFRLVIRDFHALSTAFRFNTPRGVFANDISYVEIADSNAWHNADIFTGLSEAAAPHSDWVQIRITGGAVYRMNTTGSAGSSSIPWLVGHRGYDPVSNYIYVVTASTGGRLIDPLNPPTGTGTGIVSGNVTFNYEQTYNLDTEMVVVLENSVILQDGTTLSDHNAQPDLQFVINSGGGVFNNTYTWAIINNIAASSNTRGIDGATAPGTTHVEWNSFVGGATKAKNNEQARIRARSVRARHNITGFSGGQPFIEGTADLSASGNVAANFANGAVSPSRPGDVMRGSFTDLGGGFGWGYSMVDNETVTAAEFRSAMSKQMHHITGAAGAKLREVHTITVGSEDYEIEISE